MDITGTEYAKRKGLSRQWVCSLLRQGRVEGARLIGRTWFIPEDTDLPDALRRGRPVDIAEAGRKRAEYVRYVARQEELKKAQGRPSERHLFLEDMDAMGWSRRGRWIVDDGHYVGPWWMPDEYEADFLQRKVDWKAWDAKGRPVELTPKDFAEWLAGNTGD